MRLIIYVTQLFINIVAVNLSSVSCFIFKNLSTVHMMNIANCVTAPTSLNFCGFLWLRLRNNCILYSVHIPCTPLYCFIEKTNLFESLKLRCLRDVFLHPTDCENYNNENFSSCSKHLYRDSLTR
jgi:hypothetical protein